MIFKHSGQIQRVPLIKARRKMLSNGEVQMKWNRKEKGGCGTIEAWLWSFRAVNGNLQIWIDFFFLFPVAMATWESSFSRGVLTDLSGEGTELGWEYHNSLQNTQLNQTNDRQLQHAPHSPEHYLLLQRGIWRQDYLTGYIWRSWTCSYDYRPAVQDFLVGEAQHTPRKHKGWLLKVLMAPGTKARPWDWQQLVALLQLSLVLRSLAWMCWARNTLNRAQRPSNDYPM